ncbi:hypothetical protein CYMTET_3985 [Cymbomonas tetramitiformis]|uniref:DUF4218 domain-containing protein n=1 Tax=Cymbomonas tetramitiformis TaxID=36881 RepID=A0AAE0H265_9CHLO|nr:hypothetical protein CYMTET_3985 [Cymbomonas tetramitiformis]
MEGTKKKTKKKAKPKKAKCRFYHWRIEDLLRRVYSNPTTAGLMRSHGTRRTPGTTELFDIPDGSEWKEKQAAYPDFFESLHNVVILLCADGASVWKDGSGVFPIYFQILNLPPEIRKRFENLELYGLMAGKPANTAVLYEKLVEELLHLWHEGFHCWDAHTEEVVKARVMLLAVVFDYKGLTDAMRIMDVGSFSGCAKCKIRGRGKCPHMRKMVYKFSEQDPPGPSDLKTDEFIRRAAKTHASMSACETAAFLKDILEESIRSTGVKFPAAFMRLPYFDLLKNVIIDGMHQIRNIGLHCHEGLMGFDFSPAVREHARANGMHPSWWKRSRNTEGTEYYVMTDGPFAIPPRAKGSTTVRCRETWKKWTNKDLATPRPWGEGHKKLLCPNGSNTAPKTLKCHEALKMLQAGIFSMLASADRDEGYGTNSLKELMGRLTVIVRELTMEIVDPEDVPKLQRLVNEFLESLEVNGSPDWLVINTHLLSHLPDQLLMYGPMRGTWMYVFESFNGRIRGWVKNNAYPVQSIMQGVGRYKMVQSIRGLTNVLRRRQEEATQVLPAVGLRRPLPFLATSPLFEEYRNTVVVATTGTRYHLTVDERAKLGIWMYANIPTYHVLKEKYAAFVTYANRYAMIENIFRVELGGKLYVLVKGKWFPEFNKVTKERFAKCNSKYGPDNVAKLMYTYAPQDPATPWDTVDPFILATQIEHQVVIKKHPYMETAVILDLKADFFECIIKDDGSREGLKRKGGRRKR